MYPGSNRQSWFSNTRRSAGPNAGTAATGGSMEWLRSDDGLLMLTTASAVVAAIAICNTIYNHIRQRLRQRRLERLKAAKKGAATPAYNTRSRSQLNVAESRGERGGGDQQLRQKRPATKAAPSPAVPTKRMTFGKPIFDDPLSLRNSPPSSPEASPQKRPVHQHLPKLSPPPGVNIPWSLSIDSPKLRMRNTNTNARAVSDASPALTKAKPAPIAKPALKLTESPAASLKSPTAPITSDITLRSGRKTRSKDA